MSEKDKSDWQSHDAQVFWGEIAPCDHVLQIYENDEILLDSLEGFVSSGFQAGDCVIIIATDEHLSALNRRLIQQGVDLASLVRDDHFIPLNAETMLSKFMVGEWPDETLFMALVKKVIARARGNTNRRVRAYGEMVAILWAKGHSGATVQLEHLWNKFCETEDFCLFCAYPKSGFTQGANESLRHICTAHTKMLDGERKSKKEVFYKSVA